MNDIKLLETCNECGEHLTLMESIRVEDNTLWAVKRCLNCGGHFIKNSDNSISIEEVARLYVPFEKE